MLAALAAGLSLVWAPAGAQTSPDPRSAEIRIAQASEDRFKTDQPSEETPVDRAKEIDQDEGSTPRLEVEIDIEIQNDGNFASDDRFNQFNDLFTTTEPGIGFFILPELSLQSGLVLEPVDNTEPGRNRFFDDHGLFVEQLFVLWDQDEFAAYGGKFNPPFGIAWDVTPGIYGTEVAEEFYEQTEKIGFGGAINLGGDGIGGEGFGAHTISAQTYFADTSILSDSFGLQRGPLRISDGGPSNTEDLSSFSITVDGGDFEGVPADPGYHLGFIRNEKGRDDTDAEFGVAGALTATIEPMEDLAIEPLVEYVYFEGQDGVDQRRHFLTAALGNYYGSWNLAVAHSSLWSDPRDPEVERVDFHQTQVSAGYTFDFGLDVDIGYRFIQENAVDTHTVGILFHYNFGFEVDRNGGKFRF